MTTNPDGPIIRPDDTPQPRFLRSSLRDPAFYAANEKQILEAARAGRIIDDITATKPRWGKDWGRL
jgi:hypothetical protein